MGAAASRIPNARRTEATTARLIAVARRLFAERGYARTATEDVAAAAEVTRGALYHHFKGKDALFEAVFLQIQAEIGARIEAAGAAHTGLRPQIMAGCRAFLEMACEPDIRQIVLRDAPAVLGLEAWRLADERNATFRLRRSLAALDREQGGGRFDVEAMTVLLNGALNEAATWIAQADDPAAALRRASASFAELARALDVPRDAAPERAG
ncbi:MAG: TetR/AcrR family transcriptional regulator [Methylobacteriaceae bacterium]|nr:TetR/AcrR family transcriptional regulator [Methylobacteriaceae bacterium]